MQNKPLNVSHLVLPFLLFSRLYQVVEVEMDNMIPHSSPGETLSKGEKVKDQNPSET